MPVEFNAFDRSAMARALELAGTFRDGFFTALAADLPALRAVITGGAEAWHPMPTRAIRSAPPAIASAYAIVLAQ